MAYEPLENEMVINCLSCEGGSIARPLATMQRAPVIVGVHDSNIWFEIHGIYGFSIDKDIAVCLLNKIAQVDSRDLPNTIASVMADEFKKITIDSEVHKMD